MRRASQKRSKNPKEVIRFGVDTILTKEEELWRSDWRNEFRLRGTIDCGKMTRK